ncbi:MAG: NUDIX domain-containing protein [Myxococcota bacterium]|nr:NUDIX domain-containing protein [Myxococcota bacterium]
MGAIRTAARALIFRDGRLLLARCRDADGDWYMAPGGGQHEGESLPETLVRECREELGAEIEVVGLRFVRDYIVAHHAFSYLDEAAHQLEVFFECRVSEDYEAGLGTEPDARQVGVVWADHEMLAQARVYPAQLKRLTRPEGRSEWPLYWGEGEAGEGD